MTHPLLAMAIPAPLLFPSLSPFAVWHGLACIAVCVWVIWKADEMGHSEGTLRSLEAAEWLRCMGKVKVG